jgi:hypothetical protein
MRSVSNVQEVPATPYTHFWYRLDRINEVPALILVRSKRSPVSDVPPAPEAAAVANAPTSVRDDTAAGDGLAVVWRHGDVEVSVRGWGLQPTTLLELAAGGVTVDEKSAVARLIAESAVDISGTPPDGPRVAALLSFTSDLSAGEPVDVFVSPNLLAASPESAALLNQLTSSTPVRSVHIGNLTAVGSEPVNAPSEVAWVDGDYVLGISGNLPVEQLTRLAEYVERVDQ